MAAEENSSTLDHMAGTSGLSSDELAEEGIGREASPPSPAEDRKEKKRIQNRVAQRSYRQRMKTRVEELQARIKMLEGFNNSSWSLDTVQSSLPPISQPFQLPSQPQPSLDFSQLITSTEPAGQSHLYYNNGSNNSSNFMMMESTPPVYPPSVLSSSSASLPTDFHTSTTLPGWQYPHDPVPDAANMPPPLRHSSSSRKASGPTIASSDSSSANWQSATSSEPHRDGPMGSRLRYVADHARRAGFEGLDDLITAYYRSLSDEETGLELSDVEGHGSRRLPHMIATLRHAIAEWRDWEQKGFPLD